jgi:hypothetical protein
MEDVMNSVDYAAGGISLAALLLAASAAPACEGTAHSHSNLTQNRTVCGQNQFRVSDGPCLMVKPSTQVFEGRPDARRQPFYFLDKGYERGPMYGEPRG